MSWPKEYLGSDITYFCLDLAPLINYSQNLILDANKLYKYSACDVKIPLHIRTLSSMKFQSFQTPKKIGHAIAKNRWYGIDFEIRDYL